MTPPVFFAWPKDDEGSDWASGESECPETREEVDWPNALETVIPAWVKCDPESVAEYIQHLQGEIEHRRGPKR